MGQVTRPAKGGMLVEIRLPEGGNLVEILPQEGGKGVVHRHGGAPRYPAGLTVFVVLYGAHKAA